MADRIVTGSVRFGREADGMDVSKRAAQGRGVP
jgi:hypothetical protein